MPRILTDYLGLVFFFWSNEYSGKELEPIHIHISRGKQSENSTKVWIKSGYLELADNGANLTPKELAKALEYIEANRYEIIAKWYDYFVK